MKFYKLFTGKSFNSMMNRFPVSPHEELNHWLAKNRHKFLSGNAYRIIKYLPQDEVSDYKFAIFIEYFIKPKYINDLV